MGAGKSNRGGGSTRPDGIEGRAGRRVPCQSLERQRQGPRLGRHKIIGQDRQVGNKRAATRIGKRRSTSPSCREGSIGGHPAVELSCRGPMNLKSLSPVLIGLVLLASLLGQIAHLSAEDPARPRRMIYNSDADNMFIYVAPP